LFLWQQRETTNKGELKPRIISHGQSDGKANDWCANESAFTKTQLQSHQNPESIVGFITWRCGQCMIF